MNEGPSLLPTDLLAAGGVERGGALAFADAALPGADPLAFLRAARGVPRGFWQAGDRWSAWAGVAAEVAVQGGPGAQDPLAAVRERAEALRADGWIHAGPRPERPPRLFGGCAFDPVRTGAEGAPWNAFGTARFLLPALRLEPDEDGVPRLTAATRPGTGNDPARALDGARGALDRSRDTFEGVLRDGRPAGPFPPAARRVRPRTTRRAWRRSVVAVRERIGRGEVEKVVLARAVDVHLASEPDPVDILARLRTRDPGAWLFLMEPRPGRAFVGASPELLCGLSGGELRTMAVAGSAPRDGDPAADRRRGRELLESRKERAEHGIGVLELRERLLRLGLEPRVDPEPRLLRLADIQHLRTDLSASVGRGDAHVLDILRVLHPTAAVCGHPRDAARRVIGEEEPLARGWYAGPVGWFDLGGGGEFAPGLRSAVLAGRRLRLFAGAGIVAASEPDREWEEVRVKLGTVLRALGVAAEPAAP